MRRLLSLRKTQSLRATLEQLVETSRRDGENIRALFRIVERRIKKIDEGEQRA